MLVTTTSERQGRVDRPRRAARRAWRRRSRRATFERPCGRYPMAGRAGAQGAAALHHLRQRRRRQVDADRAAALRQQADLRRPIGGSGSRQRRHGTQGEDIDFALLVDGLSAEREQGITIDVAYRFFASEKRKFIVADTPGHEQYTRNMVTGASTADLAVLLVDARKGVLTQTRRHSYLAQLLGIRHFVLAVTKMDLVDFDQAAFDAITADYRVVRRPDRNRRLGRHPGFGPGRRQYRRAERADALVRRARRCWSISTRCRSIRQPKRQKPLRMPVQWVNRPAEWFRGFAGPDCRGLRGAGHGRPSASIGPDDAHRAGADGRRATLKKRLLDNP